MSSHKHDMNEPLIKIMQLFEVIKSILIIKNTQVSDKLALT